MPGVNSVAMVPRQTRYLPFKNSSLLAATRPSTPTPSWLEASSLAMNTAATVGFSTGFFSASCTNSSVTAATWPRQSVVPRPHSLSPSTSFCQSFGQGSDLSLEQSTWLFFVHSDTEAQ